MLNAAARTHAGRVRPQNEDALVCRPEAGLFAVIDGMGGEEAGEVAAAIAAAALAEVPGAPRQANELVLVQALDRARERILAEQQAEPRHGQMGAVATAVRFADDGRTVAIAHVGDTRVYRVGARGVERLTDDHLAPEPAAGSGKRPVTRDLGRRDLRSSDIDRRQVTVARGELLVLCSDGLYDPVGDEGLAEELRRVHAEGMEPDAAAARLVALALARGGPDNVTVVVVRVGSFRRGRRLSRLGWAGTVFLLGGLGVLALGIASSRGTGGPAALPGWLRGVRTLPMRDTWSLPAGGRVEVLPGATAVLRGSRVEGPHWELRVGAGGVLTVERAVVDIEGEWAIHLDPGARLLLRDSRVEVGAFSLTTTPEAVATFEHVGVHAGSGWPPPEGTLRTFDVRSLTADGEPADPPGVEPPAEPPPDPASPSPGAPR